MHQSSWILALSNELHKMVNPYLSVIEQPFIPIFAPFYSFNAWLTDTLQLGSESAVMFLLFFLGSFPLALIHRFFIPKGTLTHLYSLVFGLLFCFLTFQWNTLHSLFVALVGYLGMFVLPPRIASVFTFVFGFCYLLLCHIYRIQTDYGGWSLDFSTLQMLATLKIISVPFNYWDGVRLKQNKEKAEQTLYKAQISQSIDRIPNPLEYFGYLYFYGCVLSGPIYEFKHYLDFANYKTSPFDPATILKRIGMGFFSLFLYVILGSWVPDTLREPVLSTYSFWQILLLFNIVVASVRPKYYVAWYFGEGAAITAGLGYSGHGSQGQKGKWKHIDQADMLACEVPENMRSLVNNWNKSVSRWLRYYVFCRLGKNQERTKSNTLVNMLATFVISAIWHGVYGGYYLFWFFMVFITETAKTLHRKLRPRVFKNEERYKQEPFLKRFVYRSIATTLTLFFINYYGASFVLLSLTDSLHFYSKIYFVGHIGTIVAYLYVTYVMRRPKGVVETSKEE